MNDTLRETRTAAKAATDAVEEARKANRQAREMMEIDKRPWVSEVGIRMDQPLTFEENGDATFSIRIPMRNFGDSVAVDVRVHVEAMLMASGNLPEIEERRNRLCKSMRRDRYGFSPFRIPLLFPKQDPDDLPQIPTTQGITGQAVTPESFPGFNLRIEKKDIEERADFQSVPLRKFIFPIVYGCIDYRAAFSSDYYGLGFIYYVLRKVPNDQTGKHFYVGENILINEMLLRKDVSLSSYIYEDKKDNPQ